VWTSHPLYQPAGPARHFDKRFVYRLTAVSKKAIEDSERIA